MHEITMKKLILIGCLLLPATVFAFPIEVEQQLNGAEIDIQTLDLGNNTGSVSLHNYGPRAAVCTARFRNGPESPRTRKARIASGDKAHLTARFSSAVIKLRVQVECKPD